MERRQVVQERIAYHKGNKSRDSFAIGDHVRVKSNLDGRWTTRGTIQEARPSGSSSPPASFLILTDSGKEIIRHKSYIKHEVLETDLYRGNVSAAGLVDHENLSAAGPVVTVTPAEPDPSPTGQENTHSEHDSAKTCTG